MKIIIAGSREINWDRVWPRTPLAFLHELIVESGFDITEVVSGTARGIDQLGELWAQQHEIPVKLFPANWAVHGRSAGYRRNEQMAEYADGLITIWDGQSRGTEHMSGQAVKHRLKHVQTVVLGL